MRTLVVLRHGLTKKDRGPTATGSHLSAAGVRQARALGEALPAFGHVAVGDQPRHLETALALGYAVDEQVSWPSGYVDGEVEHHDQWAWAEPFVTYAGLLTAGTGLDRVVRDHLAHWRRVLELVGDGGSALLVSSGGSIEPVLVAAVPGADHPRWGGPLHHLEGAALTWDGGAFTRLDLVRGGRPPSWVRG